MTYPETTVKNVVLMDDDPDDFLCFQLALAQIAPEVNATHIDNFLLDKTPGAWPRPDLLFLDLKMPGKDGFEWLRRIRSNFDEQLPIIVYSTSASQAQVKKAYEMGADLYCIKGTSISKLADCLTQVLHMDWSQKSEWRNQCCNAGIYLSIRC